MALLAENVYMTNMLLAGLPAIKPDFMQGPASKAKKAKKQQQKQQAEEDQMSDFEALGNVDISSPDSDEDWTPDMERKKRARGLVLKLFFIFELMK